MMGDPPLTARAASWTCWWNFASCSRLFCSKIASSLSSSFGSAAYSSMGLRNKGVEEVDMERKGYWIEAG